MFGTLSAARAYDEERDPTAYDVGIEVGADVSDDRRRGFLCPVVAVSASFGPRNFLLFQGTDSRRFSGAIGLGLAGVAWRTRHVAVHPAAGLRVARLWAGESYPGGHHEDSDTYFLFGGGIGLVFMDVVTIRPGVSVPFGLLPPISPDDYAVPFGREEQELSFDIGVGINFGRRSARSPR